MDLAKSSEFFNPAELTNGNKVHIIGCGSVGSALVELLARLGITKFVLYDFDKVEGKNIANQMFFDKDIHKMKVDVCKELITAINPEAEKDIVLHPEGYTGQRLAGYVFLAVDNIELRRKIVEDNMMNSYIKAMFDIRTGLTDAQHFAADWSKMADKKQLLGSMQFSHEDAKADTPVSACGIELSVASTIRVIVSFAVTNFMNFTMGKPLKKFIQCDAFNYVLDAF